MWIQDVQLELIYETLDIRSCLKSVLADNDYIQCLGRNFLSTGYVLPTWKTIQWEVNILVVTYWR
jgi:hypothetical protein